MSKNSQQQEWEDFVSRVRAAVESSGGPSLVATRSGLARRTVNAYLVGETDPSRERILALAQATDVRPEWLLTGQGPMRLEGVAEQASPYRAEALDAELLHVILDTVVQGLTAAKKKLPPKVFATLVVTIYEAALYDAGMRKDLASRVQPFIRLALAGAG